MMLRALRHSFNHSPLSAVSLHKSIAGSYFFAKPLTTQCRAAILRLKLRLNFRILSQNATGFFSLISSPVVGTVLKHTAGFQIRL